MITDQDIKKLKLVFATKEDLKVTTESLITLIDDTYTKIDRSLDHIKAFIYEHEIRLDKIEKKIKSN